MSGFKEMDRPPTVEELADALCAFCPMPENQRGVSGGPNGPIYGACAEGCPEWAVEEAYDQYLANWEWDRYNDRYLNPEFIEMMEVEFLE